MTRVERGEEFVTIYSSRGVETFDEVVFACHSDQALRLLQQPTEEEREVLTAFPYSGNDVILHTDTSILPRRKLALSSWNYRIRSEVNDRTTVTYNMNILQGIQSQHCFCVSLNDVEHVAEDRVLAQYRYSHPIFSIQRSEMQTRHSKLIRQNRTSYCGAYWGNGFHEDGVVSALAVCRKFGANDVLDVDLSGDKEVQGPGSDSVSGSFMAGA